MHQSGHPATADLRIAGSVIRRTDLTLMVDGRPVPAAAGENLAAALLAAGIRRLGESFRGGTPRGALCFMGVCQECVVQADGARVQACMIIVRDGMSVTLSRL